MPWANLSKRFFIKFDISPTWESRRNDFWLASDLIKDSFDIGHMDMVFLFDTEEIRDANVAILHDAKLTEFSIGDW